MYQALYRKYRPQTFFDVSGQDTVTATLQNAVKTGRVSHAYLFCGIRGTGKTTCAKILAKAVNCLNPKDGNPCGECENCKAVQEGATDIIELDAASNNGVDYIRELREQVAFMPSVLKYRVYIIDEVHMLSTSAFNALLKTLEEPPAHVIFILATTEINKIPATIVSRCQRYDFKRISNEVIAERLTAVAKSENINLTDDAAALIASLSDGGLRDAISLLDLCASLNDTVDLPCVQNACGSSGFDDICKIIGCILSKDSDGLFTVTERLYREGHDMKILIGDVLAYLRNIMIIKTAKNPAPLVGLTPDRFKKTEQAAQGFSLEYVMYCIKTLSESAVSNNPKIDAQLSLIKTLYPKGVETSAVLPKPEKSEKNEFAKQPDLKPQTVQTLQTADKKVPEKAPEKVPEKQPQKSDIPASTTQIKEGKLKEWQKVLDLLKTANRPLFGVLYNSTAYFENGRVLIDSPLSSFREMINSNPSTKEALKCAIADVYGKAFPIGPYQKNKNEAQTPIRDGEDDPLVAFDRLIK